MFVSSFKRDLQIFGNLGSIAAFLPMGDLLLQNYPSAFGSVPFALS